MVGTECDDTVFSRHFKKAYSFKEKIFSLYFCKQMATWIIVDYVKYLY